MASAATLKRYIFSTIKRYIQQLIDSGTLGGSASISDTAYDATSWDGVTATAPSKNSVRDKIEALAGTIPTVSDTAYNATSWDGVTAVAPSKNAVRDKIEALAATIPAAGPTNGAGSNVIPKSNGTNLVASNLSDSGTKVTSAVQMQLAAGAQATPGVQIGTTAGNGIFGDDSRLVAIVGNQGGVQINVGSTGGGGSGGVGLYINNNQVVEFAVGGISQGSNRPISWSNSTTNVNTLDSGIARAAAGLVKITDGASGLGKLAISGGTPASASASGVAGQILWDSSFVYVCVATNTWVRAPLATW